MIDETAIFKKCVLYNTLDEEPMKFGLVNKGIYLNTTGTQIVKGTKDDGCAEFTDPIKIPEGYKNGIFFLPFKILDAKISAFTMFGVYKKSNDADLNRRLFNQSGTHGVYSEGGKISNGKYSEYDCEINEYEGCIMHLKIDITNGTLSVIQNGLDLGIACQNIDF